MTNFPNINFTNRIADLISGYLLSELNEEELKELEEWINESQEHMEIFESVLDETCLEDQGRVYAAIDVTSALIKTKKQMKFGEIPEIHIDRNRKRLWVHIAAAASILIICTIGVYYFNNPGISGLRIDFVKQSEIKPGSNKATLTLANGKKIVLSTAVNGELANEAGVRITKTADGLLVYKIVDQNEPANFQLNTLSTANGEQYQVSLPDGTKVWLNAATSLKYPTSFSRTKERRVELNGEAYFEVVKDSAHPFVVSTVHQTVVVLGTHFNINSYSNEEITKTTLLEGSVKINDRILLKVGQEAVLTKLGTLAVHNVDTESIVAWKNGLFIFENEEMKTAMNKIARWYNVEILYEDRRLELITVGGSISRFDKVEEILSLFEKAGNIQFEIKGRTITIRSKK